MSQILKPKKGYKKVKWLFRKEIEIPEEWEMAKLENLFSVGSSKRVLESQWQSEGIPFYRGREITSLSKYGKVENKLFISKDLYEEYTSKYGVPKVDDILITAIGTIGNSYLVKENEKFYFKDASVLWLDKTSNMNSKFINYWLKSERFFQQLDKGNGSTVDSLTIKKLQSIRSPLPPLQEQDKISTILSNVDNLINSTHTIIEQTISIKKGLMQKLFAKGIGHKKFKKAKWLFGKEIEIPEEWEIKQLEDVLKIVQYGISEPMFEEGEYPIFRMNSIQKSKVIELDMKFIDLTKKEFKKYRLEKKDLLFNRTNSYELVGKIGVFLLEGDYTFAGYLIRLRTNEKMNPIFLNNYLNTKQSRYNVKRFATPAVSQTNINATNLKSVIIIVPSRQEQDKIASILSHIDSQIQSQTQYKEKLERLKKSLMQKLLTGQVRVAV